MSSALVPGTTVVIRQERWTLVGARRDGDVVRLEVAARHRRAVFLAPFDRVHPMAPRRRPRRVGPARARAVLARLVADAFTARTISSAVGAGIDLHAWQLEPALAVLSGRRRLLIADEVGLGKTIQAGLCLAEACRRQPGTRALILAPASIHHQWRAELADRFGLVIEIATPADLDRRVRSTLFGVDPWRSARLWIASIDYVKQAHVLPLPAGAAWDLVIVDEAHDVCGESARHRAAHEIASAARTVLLLSATPHPGDPARFDRLRTLGAITSAGDAGTLARADRLVVFRRTRMSIGLPAGQRVRWLRTRASPDEAAVFAALTAFERAALAAAGDAGATRLVLALLRKRALSTMRALRLTVQRRLAWIDSSTRPGPAWFQPGLAFEPQDDELSDADRETLCLSTGLIPARERAHLRRLRDLVAGAERADGALHRLATLVRRAQEPVVIFTEFRDSLAAIVERLAPQATLATLHGGQSDVDRQHNLAAFLTGGARVLVATDVAGQGLNLQHRARWIVNVDLPWTPVRLVQRAGRVDRLGQRRPVHVTLLARGDPAEASVLARLAERALRAESDLGSPMFGDVLPEEAQVVAAVFGGDAAPVAAPASGQVRLDGLVRRWAAVARDVAIDLQRRRRLMSRGRRPVTGGRALTTPRCRLPHLAGLAGPGQSVLVFRVPVLDGTGTVLESHLVAITTPWRVGSMSRASADEVRNAAAVALDRRVRRLTRRTPARLAIASAVDDALFRRFESRLAAPPTQSGLFDRRAEREVARRESRRDTLTLERETRDRDTSARRTIVLGTPELVMALER
jgi:superfamily II DNA or RNA helicase